MRPAEGEAFDEVCKMILTLEGDEMKDFVKQLKLVSDFRDYDECVLIVVFMEIT